MATITIAGKSNTKYTFQVLPLPAELPTIGAIYVMTKREKNSDGSFSHTYIYVGETKDLKDRHQSHHKQDCFDEHGVNCLCFLEDSSDGNRLFIEADLIDSRKWPCNG